MAVVMVMKKNPEKNGWKKRKHHTLWTENDMRNGMSGTHVGELKDSHTQTNDEKQSKKNQSINF